MNEERLNELKKKGIDRAVYWKAHCLVGLICMIIGLIVMIISMILQEKAQTAGHQLAGLYEFPFSIAAGTFLFAIINIAYILIFVSLNRKDIKEYKKYLEQNKE